MPVQHGRYTTPPIGQFGAWRVHGRHHGLDQYAAEGTPIFAAGFGRVVTVGNNPDTTLGYGHYTIIHMDDGHTVLDAHMLTTPAVRVGQRVTSKTLLGHVGATGNAVRVGPHDHVEVRKPSGTLSNPTTYLKTKTIGEEMATVNEIWARVVNRGGKKLTAIQELADAKTNTIAILQKLDTIKTIALSPAQIDAIAVKVAEKLDKPVTGTFEIK